MDGNWVSMSLADTVSVKKGAQDGALCSFKTAVVFSHRRLGILGLDESSGVRPGETASAWGGTGSGSGYGASHLCVFWADSQMGGAALPQEEDFPLYVQESREVRCRV